MTGTSGTVNPLSQFSLFSLSISLSLSVRRAPAVRQTADKRSALPVDNTLLHLPACLLSSRKPANLSFCIFNVRLPLPCIVYAFLALKQNHLQAVSGVNLGSAHILSFTVQECP